MIFVFRYTKSTAMERSREKREKNTTPKIKKSAKTQAERAREYRARQKALKNNFIESNTNKIPSQSNLEDNRVTDVCEEETSLLYKLLKQHADDENIKITAKSKKRAKTQAQRCREYRERIKMLKLIEEKNGTKRKKTPKTAAQRNREYRERQRALRATVQRQLTCESSNSSQFSDCRVINCESLPVIQQQLSTMEENTNINNTITSIVDVDDSETARRCVPYSGSRRCHKVNPELKTKFIAEKFEHLCTMCGRLWHKESSNGGKKVAIPIDSTSSIVSFNDNKTIDRQQQSSTQFVCPCTTTAVSNIQSDRRSDMMYFSFHYGHKSSLNMPYLQGEFRRLAMNRRDTRDNDIIDFIIQRRGLSIYTVNCPIVQTHSNTHHHPTDVVHKSNVVILSKTWSNEEEEVSLPRFNCTIKYKSPTVRTDKMTVTHNQHEMVNIGTVNMEMTVLQSQSYASVVTSVGDLCIAKCKTLNGKDIIIAAIYVTPNQKLNDIIYFIHRSLLIYTHAGAKILGTNDDKLPLILGGNFGLNFTCNDTLHQLNDFLREKFNLHMNHDSNNTPMKSRTIDTIFSRHLDNIDSRTYISFFNYHNSSSTK